MRRLASLEEARRIFYYAVRGDAHPPASVGAYTFYVHVHEGDNEYVNDNDTDSDTDSDGNYRTNALMH